MHSFSAPFVLHALPISSSLTWSLCLARSTSYELTHYAIFSTLLSLHLSSDQIFSSAPCSQTPSVCVPPLSMQVCKNKVKLSLCLTNSALRHEGVGGSGCIDPCLLDLGTSWSWVVSFSTRLLYPRGKSPRHPSDKKPGEPHSRSGRRGENSWPYRDSTSDPSVVQPVASRYTIALSRLLAACT
jgi:hypothetical protein